VSIVDSHTLYYTAFSKRPNHPRAMCKLTPIDPHLTQLLQTASEC